MSNTVLITGGLGFLGSNLTKRLTDQGDAVIIVDPGDDVDSLMRVGIDPERVLGWSGLDAPKAELGTIEVWPIYSRGVLNATGWARIQIDRIYHLGADASPPAYKHRPKQSLLAGSLGTHEMVELLMQNQPDCRMLLASTSEVYGDPDLHPQHESYRGNVDPIGPRSMYDEAKRYAEAYCASVIRDGYDVRIARIFNTFGPGMRLDDGRMVTEFISACFGGRFLKVHVPGTQTRTLCYVDDLLDGLTALMEVEPARVRNCLGGTDEQMQPPKGFARGMPTPVNLGGEHEVTVIDVAEEIRTAWMALTGERAPEIQLVGQPCSQDPKRRCPDLYRAKTLLGYKVSVPWKAGIYRTVEHFLSIR